MTPILRDGEPMLAQRCQPVTSFFDDDFFARRLADSMREAMRMEHGIGLAAPQIGVPVRAFMIEHTNLLAEAYFNPVMVVGMDGQSWKSEGCLSFPGVFVRVRRWNAVQYRAQTVDGVPHAGTLRGRDAHVFQHELDHLNGRTLRDLVPAQAFATAAATAKLRAT